MSTNEALLEEAKELLAARMNGHELTSARELLLAAAAHIHQFGWRQLSQEAPFAPGGGWGGCCCAVEAISAVAPSYGAAFTVDAALTRLRAALPRHYLVPTSSAAVAVWKWNDAREITADDVITTMLRAAGLKEAA